MDAGCIQAHKLLGKFEERRGALVVVHVQCYGAEIGHVDTLVMRV